MFNRESSKLLKQLPSWQLLDWSLEDLERVFNQRGLPGPGRLRIALERRSRRRSERLKEFGWRP